jgi:molybdopterin-containing oxidoreductase family iron-sulfur binding subunit
VFVGITRRELLKGVTVAAASVLPLAAEEAHARSDDAGAPGSDRIRRWAMVIDLRRCDGCSSLGVPPQCTQNCNWARFVPDGQEWIECYAITDSGVASAGSDYLVAPCMQCQNAPCVNVCPVGASFHSPEGVVLIDQERCIGCRLCMAACPYDRRFFNWSEPVQPPQVVSAPYNVQTQVPAMRGTVMKCDFCMDRMAAGGLPTCVEACPHHAIYIGDLEEGIATNGAEMADLELLLAQDGVQRYKEDLGTEPRVYYIPGRGELNSIDDEAREKGFEQTPGSAFMKDWLEWPWAHINEELDRSGLTPATGSPGAM